VRAYSKKSASWAWVSVPASSRATLARALVSWRVVEGGHALEVVGVVLDLLHVLAFGLELFDQDAGFGGGAFFEPRELVDVVGERLELVGFLFLLGDHLGDRVFVLLDAGFLLAHDAVVGGLNDVGVGAEGLAGLVDAAGDEVTQGTEVARFRGGMDKQCGGPGGRDHCRG